MADSTPGTTPVTDHRVSPRGVLPRHAQTWLMIAVALGILAIIVFAGDPAPAASTVAAAPAPVTPPNADRLRDYQDRLRVLDERTREQLAVEPEPQPLPPSTAYPYGGSSGAASTPDPIVEERRRREYESLFASNVVISRRPEAERLTAGESRPSRREASLDGGLPAAPTIDDVADAVVRATSRLQPSPATTAPFGNAASETASVPAAVASATQRPTPVATGPISSLGPVHPVLEGTLIDAVLTNRLDGSVAAPVNCLVTNPVYSHDGRYVLIPAGARVLGETHPVQTFGETRLAVSFDRLVMPDGRTYRLDQFMGLNDIGDAGLRDQVNQHYKSTFGASAAVGLISGLAQVLGTGAFNRGGGDRTVVITGGMGDAAAQSTAQVMNRYLNRPPSITIREGHRVKVYVTSDFALPPWNAGSGAGGSMLAATR